MHAPPLPRTWTSPLPFPRSSHTSLPNPQHCASPVAQPRIVRVPPTCRSLLSSSGAKSCFLRRRKSSSSYSRHACKASGQLNDNQDNLSDDEDAFYSVQEPKPSQENLEISDHEIRATNVEDWRSFRARLVVAENARGQSLEVNNATVLANKWAHPIRVPETGCLLIATDKLDGQAPFERSVILLLRLGSSQPQDGPFGVILNRPILHTINDFEPITEKMVQILRTSLLFYGGPLATHIFLVKQDGEGIDELEEVMAGIYYGFSNGSHLQHLERFMVAKGNKGYFRNFLGYAGWDFHQLEDEIAQGFWHVAACSPDLIMETPSESLWQDVLMAMGGDYAELGKRAGMDGA